METKIETGVHGNKYDGTNVLPFSKIPAMEFCMERIANVSILNNTYEFDITPVHS